MGGRGREVRMAWPCHSREENATSSAVPARVSRGPAAGKNSLVGRSVGLEDEESRWRQTPSRRAAPSAVDG